MEQSSLKSKSEKLGIAYGTACGRLRKMILFDLIQKLEADSCYRCGKKIKLIKDLSIEHIVPWEIANDPVTTFFDLNTISFSHLSCNCSAASKPNKKFNTENAKKKAQAGYQRDWRKRQGSKTMKQIRRDKYLRTGT